MLLGRAFKSPSESFINTKINYLWVTNMPGIIDDYWGNLSDECGKYTSEPITEIKRMIDQALSDGAIKPKIYPMLEQRVPFPGVEKRSRKEIGKDYGVTGERVRQIEERTYNTILKKYLKSEIVK
jgi:hypothetical protein